MKKFIVLFFFAHLAFAQQVPLTILHWNDFHSQNISFQIKTKSITSGNDTIYFVGGSAVLKAYIEKYKKESENTLLLNAGDDFQGTPVSAITKGASQITLMNLLFPDAMTLGNHEFDYGRESLQEKISHAQFPIISANLMDKAKRKTLVPEYVIKNVGGIKVGIIGIMTEELPTLSLPSNLKNIVVANSVATIKKIIPVMKKNYVDLIVVLSHAGVDADSAIATQCSDIDVIVGGHSHTALFQPKRINGVYICQAGTRGQYLGKFDIVVHLAKDTIVSAEGKLIECRSADVTPNAEVQHVVDSLENLVGAMMNEVIGELQSDWKRRNGAESNIGNWIADALRNYAKTDFAIQNNGGIRKDLLAGPIRVRDMWEISPFGNSIVKITVDGATIKKMIEFQGNLQYDFCQFSGLNYSYSITNGKFAVKSITINGAPIVPNKKYTFTTNSYVQQQSKKYFGIDFPKKSVEVLNVADRDVLLEAVKTQKIIDAKVEGRIVQADK